MQEGREMYVVHLCVYIIIFIRYFIPCMGKFPFFSVIPAQAGIQAWGL